MQFEQLAGVILVGGPGAGRTVRQVIQHRRGTGHGFQQGAEIAQGVLADHFAVVDRQSHRDGIGTEGVDIEMVAPELGQHLAQRIAAIDGADQGGGDHLVAGPSPLGGMAGLGVQQGPERLDGPIQAGEGPLFIDGGPMRVGGIFDIEPNLGEALDDFGIVARWRGQLRFQPRPETPRHERRQIGGTGTIAEPAQHQTGESAALALLRHIVGLPRHPATRLEPRTDPARSRA